MGTDTDDGALQRSRSRSRVAGVGSGNPSARSSHTCSAAAAFGGDGRKPSPATTEASILSFGLGPTRDGIVAPSSPYPIPPTYASVPAAAAAVVGETSAGDTIGGARVAIG